MSGLVLKDAVAHTIGGGWGEDSAAPGLEPVRVIRGADFPAADMRDLQGLPHRFEVARNVPSRTLATDDIVLEISGGTKDRPTGRVVRITESMVADTECPLIPASFCRLIRINPAVAVPAFVFYVLRLLHTTGGTWAFQNQSTGLSNFQFRLFADTFELPSIAMREQRSIADLLGALDDRIASSSRLVAIADDLATARFLGVTDGGRVDLGSIAQIVMGSSPPGASYNETGSGTPFFQGVRDFGVRWPRQRVWTNAPVRTAEEGDVLLSVRAPIGTTNVAPTRLCIGRGLASVRSTSGRPHTLFYQLRGEPGLWAPFESEGTVFGSVTRAQLTAVQVRAVDPAAAEALESDLSALERIIAGELVVQDRLTATRDALLPLLMSGKLRVRDAEKVVSDVV